GDAGQVGSEILDVVETDRGHHAHFGVDDVGGVEPAAETNLDDGGVDGPVGEEGEGAGRQQLEVGVGHLRAQIGERGDVRDGEGEFLFGGHVPEIGRAHV